MTQTLTQPVDLCTIMPGRAGIIMQMGACHLALDWLKEFDIPKLRACCERVRKALAGKAIEGKDLQRELIQNPAFAAWYAKLLPMLPEEPPEEPKPAMSYSRSYAYTSRPKEPSRRGVILGCLSGLLQACQENGRDITAYPQKELFELSEDTRLDSAGLLVYMENFANMALNDVVISSIKNCVGLPVILSEKQKALLKEPFVSTRYLFCAAPFERVWNMLEATPALADIARLLHIKDVHEELTLDDYVRMAPEAKEYHRLLSSVTMQMDADAASSFITYWQHGGCSLKELKLMERRITSHQDATFATYSGYVNLLYGLRYKSIDLSRVSDTQENILIYAIVHNKKHFIKLVDEHSEIFLSLPSGSILFAEKLYKEHFNLNELTESDLCDCTRMYQLKFDMDCLTQGRRYTFPELKALYGVSAPYRNLYNLLQSDSQDYRLRILRQLHKRKVLQGLNDVEITSLAKRLDEKPLYDWMDTDFAHIAGLTTPDAARLLAHLEAVRNLLFSIRCRTDALLAVRNPDILSEASTVSELHEKLLKTDADWLALAQRMGLTPEFLTKYRESIVGFVCSNGAHIAETYRSHLGSGQEQAFLRVVKAELMGRLPALKYFDGDLQRELDTPLTGRVKAEWKKNLRLESGGIEAGEYDDFISTMQLGVQPQRTCLSYMDGAYRECLLSAFDSNKKVLYAVIDGQVVGRAFLRLTKGRLTRSESKDEGSFTFVDLENVEATRRENTSERERVTLFLERPYISGVGPDIRERIMGMFVNLARQKAEELDTLLVLSQDYKAVAGDGFTWTRFALYISKSKAGSQYLDSLGGQATVSAEGSYKTGTFLVVNN